MSAPTLTAFIGNYNHADSVGRQIEAMASQSRLPDELIVVDDCSTDNSVEVIRGYEAKYPFLKLVRHEENQKLSGAIQTALKHGTGDFFYSGAADDFVLPGFFERAMALAEQKPDIGIIMGEMEVRDMDDTVDGVYGSSVWTGDQLVDADQFYREFMLTEPATHVCSSSVMFRSEPFAEHGGFRLELGSVADNLIMRLLGKMYGAAFVAQPCSVWYRNPGSMSDASTQNPWWSLDQAARVAWLMRNRYADVFPETYIRQWEDSFRSHSIEKFTETLGYANACADRQFKRGVEFVGPAGRLARGVISQFHKTASAMQEASVTRALSGYAGNTLCYTSEESERETS